MPNKMKKVTLEDALEKVKARLIENNYSVSDFPPNDFYRTERTSGNCWYITVMYSDLCYVGPSRLFVVDKSSGKLVCDTTTGE